MRTRREVLTVAAAAALAAAATGCGGSGGTGDDGARATVARYFAALGSAQPLGVGRHLTPASQQKLAEFGEETLKLGSRSCAATMRALFASPAGPRLRTLRNAAITRVERDGDRATISVHGVDRPVTLVRTHGHWRIESEPIGERD